MDELRNLLSVRVKRIRAINKMTQEEFCERIKIEVPTLSNIENGKNAPSLQTIINILESFKMSPNDFFNFVNWETANKDLTESEINERVKLLSEDLKLNFLEILRNIK